MTNRPKHTAFLTALTVLLTAVVASAEEKPTPINTAAAIQRAAEYLGVDISVKQPPQAELVKKPDRSWEGMPPYLDTIVDNKDVWMVTFDNILLPVSTDADSSRREYRRSFSVLLDAAAGSLIRIHSIALSDRRRSESEAAPEVREASLLSKTDFAGFPDTMPAGFVGCLRGCPHSPHLAERIAAVYVLDSSRGEQPPTPVWLISLVGIPPITVPDPSPEYTGDEIPAHMRNAVYIVCDGKTGRPLCSGT